MRRRIVEFVLATTLALPAALAAQSSATPWIVRTRALAIVPNASSTPAGLDVKSAATMEVDLSREITPWLSAELIAATAAHDVKAGATSLGSVTHLPPTLLLQLKPVQRGTVHPYVGAGVNVTFFYNKTGALSALDLGTTVGYAGQVGVDFDVAKNVLVNVDAKYIHIKPDVKAAGSTVYELKINPFVLGVGFGFRF